MLFNQDEFEHKINEENLKKGLKLVVKNKIELLDKTTNNLFTFFIHDKISGEISVQLKDNKICNYTCYCSNINYCEHLAACIFYFQQELLESELKNKSVKTLGAKGRKNKKNFFEKYLSRIKEIAGPTNSTTKINQKKTDEIIKKLNFEKTAADSFGNLFYFDLAVICEVSKHVDLIYHEKENELNRLIKDSKKNISNRFYRGLNENEKVAFIIATSYSVRSQTNFRTNGFSFFVPRAALIIKNKEDFELIRSQLKKRIQNKNRLDAVDRKIIAELQLSVMEAKAINNALSLKKYEQRIELPLALAELEFHQKNNAKGFKLLKLHGPKIKGFNLNNYLDFIDEVLVFAREFRNEKAESDYLCEKFICGFYIDEAELERYLYLAKDKIAAANELLQKLNNESVFYTFEKKATVLLNQNKIAELVDEIKKQKNKFKLLHTIALKKAYLSDPDFLQLYLKQLTQALIDAKFPYFQEQILTLAKNYLGLLPAKIRSKSIEWLREKMLYDMHVLSLIEKIYT